MSGKLPTKVFEGEVLTNDFEMELGVLIEKWRQCPGCDTTTILDSLDFFVGLLEERAEREAVADL